VIPGCQRRHIGHFDTDWLVAQADRLGKPLRSRVVPKTASEPGHLELVLRLRDGQELTADYWGAM
jgi:hypothetical protein